MACKDRENYSRFQWTLVDDRAKKRSSVPGVETSVSTPGTVFCGDTVPGTVFPVLFGRSNVTRPSDGPPAIRSSGVSMPKLDFPVLDRMRL